MADRARWTVQRIIGPACDFGHRGGVFVTKEAHFHQATLCFDCIRAAAKALEKHERTSKSASKLASKSTRGDAILPSDVLAMSEANASAALDLEGDTHTCSAECRARNHGKHDWLAGPGGKGRSHCLRCGKVYSRGEANRRDCPGTPIAEAARAAAEVKGRAKLGTNSARNHDMHDWVADFAAKYIRHFCRRCGTQRTQSNKLRRDCPGTPIAEAERRAKARKR